MMLGTKLWMLQKSLVNKENYASLAQIVEANRRRSYFCSYLSNFVFFYSSKIKRKAQCVRASALKFCSDFEQILHTCIYKNPLF